jgi:hypothetical protein
MFPPRQSAPRNPTQPPPRSMQSFLLLHTGRHTLTNPPAGSFCIELTQMASAGQSGSSVHLGRQSISSQAQMLMTRPPALG